MSDPENKLPAQGLEQFDATLGAADGMPREGSDRIRRVRWYGGEPVDRFDFMTGEEYELQLSMEPGHVDLSRINSGSAPLLNSHSKGSLDDVIGVVEKGTAAVDGAAGFADVRFADTEGTREIWQKVDQGIIRNVSIGFKINKVKDITEEGAKKKRYLAVAIQPQEISIVAIGASESAQIFSSHLLSNAEVINQAETPHNKEGSNMSDDNVNPQAADGVTVEPIASNEAQLSADANQAQVQAIEPTTTPEAFAERERRKDITELADQVGEQGIGRKAVIDGTSYEAFRGLVSAKWDADEDVSAVDGRARITRDKVDTEIDGITEALLNRVNPGKYQIEGPGQGWAQLSLMEIARDLAREHRGTSARGMSKNDVCEFAFNGSAAFPKALANTAARTLIDGYNIGEKTYEKVSRARSFPDFRQNKLVKMGIMPELLEVPEGAEFKSGTVGEGDEPITLATYGRIFGLTRQALINDDIGAFDQIGVGFGQAASQLENETAWAVIKANAAMTDGVAIFHASHANLAGSGAAPTPTTVNAGKVAMRNQTAPLVDNNSTGTKPLNIVPVYAVVPAEHENVMMQIFGMLNPAAYTDDNVPISSTFREVIVEPLLSVGTGGTATAWFLFADPARHPVLSHGFLQGASGPAMTPRQGYTIDGMEFKISHDFAVGVEDHRGGYKNAGA